jgi:large subunit ribosomal protein L18
MLTSYERRKFRVKSNIAKNNKGLRPKIVVSRSNKNFYAQLISVDGKVLQSFSTLSFEENKKSSGIDKAKLVGKNFAEKCLEAGIAEVVFDKGAYAYSGRVKALAESCREAGLKF